MRWALLLAAVFAGCAPHEPIGERPPSRREDVVEVIHGTRVADPYRWLERADEPEVASWAKAQDDYARRELDALPHRDALRARLRELLYYDSLSPPRRYGTRVFFTRQHADKEKAVYCVRGADGIERVWLDPNTMSDDGSVAVKGVFPSHDGRLVAYTLSRNNADAATLFVRDLETNRDLPIDRIDGARYAAPSWTPDSRGFYYTGLPTDPTIPPSELPGHAEVRFHRLGSDPRDDEIVHPALHDPTTFIHARVSHDGHFLFLTIARGFDAQDVSFADLRRGARELVPLSKGTRAHVIAHGDAFYVHTNDGAPRFRVMKVDPARPQRSAWRELVPERPATLTGFDVVGGHLELHYLERASSRLELRTLEGKYVRDLPLPSIGTTPGLVGRPDHDEAYFEFSSFATPPRIYRTSITTGRTELWHERDVPADTSQLEVEQVEYRSKDGTPISMFVVHRRDIVRDGNNPTILTGYGGFGLSMVPQFSPGPLLWLERGGVLAVPNLRGGGEYGEEWHEAGKLHKKQNVFDDFIAAAQWLVDQGYTRPAKLAIRGGSNGGLLVGAVSTQRPELFGAVVCAVPLLDMVRYHQFGAGRTWTSEYGSAEDPAQFRTLFAYSPYHRVASGRHYPPLLMLSADSDDRVDPMHARKYVAAMQEVTTAKTPVLLRIERNAGHGGGDNVRQAVEQAVDVYAFLFAQLAVDDSVAP